MCIVYNICNYAYVCMESQNGPRFGGRVHASPFMAFGFFAQTLQYSQRSPTLVQYVYMYIDIYTLCIHTYIHEHEYKHIYIYIYIYTSAYLNKRVSHSQSLCVRRLPKPTSSGERRQGPSRQPPATALPPRPWAPPPARGAPQAPRRPCGVRT